MVVRMSLKAYFQAGVGTIVCMHVPENVKKAVESQGIGNIIVAGHMASDSIGLNKIIELWEKDGVEVIKNVWHCLNLIRYIW